MEECSLDLFFNRDRPFGFLVGRGAVLFFQQNSLKLEKKSEKVKASIICNHKKSFYTRFFVRKIGYINFIPKSVRRPSVCPSVRLSVRPSVTFLVIVSSPKPLDVAT